jgi:two-component system response regulator YesN
LIQDIEQHLKSIVTGEIKIGIGNLVNNIKEIRTSYLNSLSVLETDGKVEYYDDLLKNLSSIEKYPAQEVLSFLNNMKSGNKEGALEDLKKIEDHISENVLSILVERYISYIILDSYIKTVNKMNIPDDRENINSILEFNRFSELREILIPRINKVCDWAARVKEKEKNKLNESIISYVDKHFTDYNLSLLQMADHFNLSIYALSRLFKEIVGVGFKEYVTGKRIELAKHLLITTEKKVGDIDVEVGFGSSSNFIRAFKANCGVSPAKYKA